MADKNTVRQSITNFIVELERLRTAMAQQTLKRQRMELKRIILDRDIVTFEVNAAYNIAVEVNSDNKPLYPNETLRKSAIQKALDVSIDYQKMIKLGDQMKKKIYRYRCEEEILDLQIKKYESLERLYFSDIENG